MLKRTLLILACIPLYACSLFFEVQEGVYDFEPIKLTGSKRERVEQLKRDFLKLEDIKVGTGPVASWDGRKIGAIFEVRYTDGSIAYRGKVLSYDGFIGSVFIHNANFDLLPIEQLGLDLGLNGMAVGGKRKIIIDPKLGVHPFGFRSQSQGNVPLQRRHLRPEGAIDS